jgi:hypothetical protein
MLSEIQQRRNYDLVETINGWLRPPDSATIDKLYDDIGGLKREAKLLQHTIRKAEKLAAAEYDKPTSNAAKLAIANAAEDDKERLAHIEAELAYLQEMKEKAEYHLQMYKNANYHAKTVMNV